MCPVTKRLGLWLCTVALAGANAIDVQAQALSGLVQMSTDSAGNFSGEVWNTYGFGSPWNLDAIEGPAAHSSTVGTPRARR